MKAILGLRTIAYYVGDLARAKEWYTRAFGIRPYFDEPYYVGFNIGGYELGLMPEDQPQTEKPLSVIAYWGVANIEKEYKRILSVGAKAHEEPNNVGGETMVATLKDPWDNIIGLIYNPKFKIEE